MRAFVDQSVCMGCGLCAGTAPDVFRMNDNGTAEAYGKRGWDFHVVKTGDTIDVGNGKQLVFVEMRMLHWPDSMATYEKP